MSKFSDYILLGDLMKPIAGVIPSGILATDEISATALNFTSGGRTAKEYRWGDWATNTTGGQTDLRRLDGSVSGGVTGTYDATNPYPFNILGQKWIRDIRPTLSGPQQYGGVKNCATPRRYTAPGAGLSDEIFPHILSFEFLFTGIAFSMVHMNLGGNNTAPNYAGNIDMYIEVDGEMYTSTATPMLVSSTSGYHTFRNVVFNQWQTEVKIRFECGTVGFTGIRTDTTSILSPSPYKLPIGCEPCDSYGESSQALCADNVNQFYLGTFMRQMYRLTTLPIIPFGQGATGFNANGAGQVFDDTVGSMTNTVFPVGNVTVTGLSRYFSGTGAGFSSRRGWLTDANTAIQGIGKPAFQNYVGEFFGGPLGTRPGLVLGLGTWNDKSSGVVTYSQMYSRVGECWDWVHTVDPYCQIVHISVEPFDDGLFNGQTGVGSLGPPRDGERGDTYVKAQRQAASERDWVKYVNCYGPDPLQRWWTGMGPALSSSGGAYNTPSNSQQAQLLSIIDSIHPKAEGTRYLGSKIVDAIADTPVHIGRVNGLV